ncbi:hypothetical protein EB061_10470 [bacterium]|nr:hypothetical protein [bacterium]
MKRATDCKLSTLISSLATLLALAACGKAPDGRPGIEPYAFAPALLESEEPMETAEISALGGASSGPAAWSHLANTESWTRAVHEVVTANFAKFDAARDRETFCPGYSSADSSRKETCWVRLVSAVVKYESNFNPTDAYRESSGQWSVGLLQLSPGECKNAPTMNALKNAEQNLICGARKMADLIARYGSITTPDNTHGAAAYWSTLRAPYVSHGLRLGKKKEVAAISRQYREVTPVVR